MESAINRGQTWISHLLDRNHIDGRVRGRDYISKASLLTGYRPPVGPRFQHSKLDPPRAVSTSSKSSLRTSADPRTPLLLILVGAPQETDVREARDAAQRGGGYQTSLPVADEVANPRAPTRARSDPKPRSEHRTRSDGTWITSAAKILLWVILGAIAIAGLFWGISEFRGRGPPEAAATKTEPRAGVPVSRDASPVPVRPGAVLPDPDALARNGEYADAIHALLLHALARLIRSRKLVLPRSLTSREATARHIHLVP